MNYLLLESYLATTNDEYATIRLTELSMKILAGDMCVTMKMPKDPDPVTEGQSSENGSPKATSKSGKTTAKSRKKTLEKSAETEEKSLSLAELDNHGRALFEQLRSLRMDIAKEEKVPPYIVFSDKTLVQMCFVRPQNKEQMMGVSGVGEFKFEKYGERFLQCIRGLV